jgi:hypothetical protein
MNGPILSEKEKIAMMQGDPSLIVSMDGKTAEDVIEERNVKNFNNQVDQYVERFEKHSTNLQEFAEKVKFSQQTLGNGFESGYVLSRT